MNNLKTIFCVVLVAPWVSAIAEPWQADELQQALQVDTRSEADQARDASRKPAQVIELLGVAPGMMVLDVMSASGYYTEVLSIAVGPEGTVYAQNPQWMLEFMNGVVDKALSARLENDRLANVQRADGELDQIGLAPESFDAAISALNFHDVYNDYGSDAALTLLQQVYVALKPGAAFVVIDHAGNPDVDNKVLHRVPEADVRELALRAGFIIDGDPDMLANPEDDHTQMVFAKGMRGNTDRFVLRLRK